MGHAIRSAGHRMRAERNAEDGGKHPAAEHDPHRSRAGGGADGPGRDDSGDCPERSGGNRPIKATGFGRTRALMASSLVQRGRSDLEVRVEGGSDVNERSVSYET
jgi:hypothetical protein